MAKHNLAHKMLFQFSLSVVSLHGGHKARPNIYSRS
jgi:hypothetical protein